MIICNTDECTGCTACANICPSQCIHMELDEKGFLHPKVCFDKCLECHLCAQVCPEMHPVPTTGESEVRLVSNNLDDDVLRSSSGGVAMTLSKIILLDGGMVFGAAYNSGMEVNHVEISDEKDLARLQGSKYVQSELGNIFIRVKELLEAQKRVLFVGTPCQIAGLLSYIPDELKELLVTCDILCAGVPSPRIFQKYVKYLEGKMGEKITNLNFRSKRYGYSYGYLHEVEDSRGKKHILKGVDSTFVRTIGLGYIRESCLTCKYRSKERVSDITIGDYISRGKNDEKGQSVVFLNSPKGRVLGEKMKRQMHWEMINWENLSKVKIEFDVGEKTPPADYCAFFIDSQILGWRELSQKYLSSATKKGKMLDRISPFLGARIKKVIHWMHR